jgi:hypothetical protein
LVPIRNSAAIHFSVIGVFRRSRCAIRIFSGAPFLWRSRSFSLQPKTSCGIASGQPRSTGNDYWVNYQTGVSTHLALQEHSTATKKAETRVWPLAGMRDRLVARTGISWQVARLWRDFGLQFNPGFDYALGQHISRSGHRPRNCKRPGISQVFWHPVELKKRGET